MTADLLAPVMALRAALAIVAAAAARDVEYVILFAPRKLAICTKKEWIDS